MLLELKNISSNITPQSLLAVEILANKRKVSERQIVVDALNFYLRAKGLGHLIKEESTITVKTVDVQKVKILAEAIACEEFESAIAYIETLKLAA